MNFWWPVKATLCIHIVNVCALIWIGKWFKWLGKIRTESVQLPTALTDVGNWNCRMSTSFSAYISRLIGIKPRPGAIRRISEETKRFSKKFEKLERSSRRETFLLIRLLFWFYEAFFHSKVSLLFLVLDGKLPSIKNRWKMRSLRAVRVTLKLTHS